MTAVSKTGVVTGANAGIGFQAASNLFRMGWQVVMACRSMDKAKRAQGEIFAEVPRARTVIIALDVSGSMAGVRYLSEA